MVHQQARHRALGVHQEADRLWQCLWLHVQPLELNLAASKQDVRLSRHRNGFREGLSSQPPGGVAGVDRPPFHQRSPDQLHMLEKEKNSSPGMLHVL